MYVRSYGSDRMCYWANTSFNDALQELHSYSSSAVRQSLVEFSLEHSTPHQASETTILMGKADGLNTHVLPNIVLRGISEILL